MSGWVMTVKAWDQLWIEALPQDKLEKFISYCQDNPPVASSIGRSRCRRLRAELERRKEIAKQKTEA